MKQNVSNFAKSKTKMFFDWRHWAFIGGIISIFVMKYISPVFSVASGSVGGVTYSRNKGGNYTRARVVGTNPNTSSQITVRSTLSTLASSWRSLTEANRRTWVSAAPSFPYTDSIGQSKIYSGFQLYMKFNAALIAAGEFAIAIAPLPGSFPETVVTGMTSSVAAPCFVSLSGTWEVTHRILVYATPPMSPGVFAPPKSAYRLINSVEGGLGEEEVISNSEYTARFGAVTAGQKIFVRLEFIIINSGQKSSAGSAFAVVVA